MAAKGDRRGRDKAVCDAKRAHPTKAAAKAEAQRLEAATGAQFSYYPCRRTAAGVHWHTAHRRPDGKRRRPTRRKRRR